MESSWILLLVLSTDSLYLCCSSTTPFQVLAASVEKRTNELKHLFLGLLVEDPCIQCWPNTFAPVCEWKTLQNKVSETDSRSILTMASLLKATHDFSIVYLIQRNKFVLVNNSSGMGCLWMSWMYWGQPGQKEALRVKYLDISTSWVVTNVSYVWRQFLFSLHWRRQKPFFWKKVSFCSPAVSSGLLVSSDLVHVHMWQAAVKNKPQIKSNLSSRDI